VAKVFKMVILRVALILGQMYWILMLSAQVFNKDQQIKHLKSRIDTMEYIING